jgi:hypothetical protein
MGKSSPAPPAAPDYAAAATAQGVANVDAAKNTAVLSNPNIISPYGNQTVSWATSPDNPNGTPQATVTQTLTPAAQQNLDAQQQTQLALSLLGQKGITRVQDVLNQAAPAAPTLGTVGSGGALDNGPSAGQYGLAHGSIDTSGIAQMPVNAGMTAQNAILSRLNPQIQQDQAALTQRLANQGIPQGSEAWNNAMRQQGNQQNDLYTQAALQGLGVDMSANQQGFGQQMSQAGLYNSSVGQNFGQGQAASSMANANQNTQFNQQLAQTQANNAAALQQYQAQMAAYNQPLNQVTALESGSQIQNPQFQQYTGANVAAAPVFQGTQAQGQADMNLYGIQQNAANSANQGLYSLGGAALGAAGAAGGFAPLLAGLSDRRLKSNIVKVGEHPLGIGIYEYDIEDRRERGVMAQEVLAVKPSAVYHRPDGYMMVDYGAL